MYHEAAVEIASLTNGDLVRVHKQFDRDKAAETCPCVHEYNEREKTVFAADVEAAAKIVAAVLPLLEEEGGRDEFDRAFTEVTNGGE